MNVIGAQIRLKYQSMTNLLFLLPKVPLESLQVHAVFTLITWLLLKYFQGKIINLIFFMLRESLSFGLLGRGWRKESFLKQEKILPHLKRTMSLDSASSAAVDKEKKNKNKKKNDFSILSEDLGLLHDDENTLNYKIYKKWEF